MLAVGRRSKQPGLPAGVRPRGGMWYWRPGSAKERAARKARGEMVEVPLGPAGSDQARKRWAEVSGHRELEAKKGTVGELLDVWERDAIGIMPSGKKRAKATVKAYTAALPAVRKRFQDALYGKTEHEASRGRAVGPADIQRFVRTGGTKAMGNIYLAVLNNAFQHGIGEGLTVYNPCADVVKNYMPGRTRVPEPWEFECLNTLAKRREQLILDYERITGDRVSEILAILRAHGTPIGIDVTRKGGKVETWDWTPELERIWSEARTLPGATPFPKSPLFPTRRGKPLSYSGFNSAWVALVKKTNLALAAAPVIDVSTLTATDVRLSIEDLHFHDWRSKTHDDAEDQKIDGAEQIGDTKAVAKRHYSRRPKRKTPLD